MHRDARKPADAERRKEHSRHRPKYAATDAKKDDAIVAPPVDSDHDHDGDKPVHASGAHVDKRQGADTDRGCVVAQPLPARLALALDAPLCYAQSVRYGKEVTLSGVWAYGRHGLLVADDDESLSIKKRARAQTKQVFRNVHDALVAAGCRGLEDITSMVVSLVDLAATAEPFFEERLKIMGDHVEYTSSVVGITGFPISGGLVHLDVKAVVGRGCLLFLTDPIEHRHALATHKPKPEKDTHEDGDHGENEDGEAGTQHGSAWVRGCVKSYPMPAHLGMVPGASAHSAISVRRGKEVTLAGIWAYGDDTRLVPGDARQQTHQALSNVRAALRQAGCRGLRDVVSINASLVDIADTFPAFVAERDRIMGAAHNDEYTSSIVGITALPVEGSLVQVDVKAVVGRGCLLGASRHP
ncbi:YjgF/Yer057c/UK114 family protein [Pandoravirus japonicus]|uniref:YjgF/Yer057c/UK114 family protein n=1 Tax=Pandoravirus japonicus TaxID=2823154 RepID=A0A811BQQ0_9VIRU|nr:YjgF/Yer057c/UK114 family protein [Pandoravirus japonicus]